MLGQPGFDIWRGCIQGSSFGPLSSDNGRNCIVRIWTRVPAIGALCISYTGPRLVQTLSDFEECLHKYNWLNSQPDSSLVGDSEGAW